MESIYLFIYSQYCFEIITWGIWSGRGSRLLFVECFYMDFNFGRGCARGRSARVQPWSEYWIMRSLASELLSRASGRCFPKLGVKQYQMSFTCNNFHTWSLA